jgi:hypothetical protein
MERAELHLLSRILENQQEIGELLLTVLDGQETLMADVTALQAELADVKQSALDTRDAVLAAIEVLQGQNAALIQQIADLTAGQVTQEQIDALTAAATEADVVIDDLKDSVSGGSSPQ